MRKDYSAPSIQVRRINYGAVMQATSVIENGGSNKGSGTPKSAESKMSLDFDTDEDFDVNE